MDVTVSISYRVLQWYVSDLTDEVHIMRIRICCNALENQPGNSPLPAFGNLCRMAYMFSYGVRNCTHVPT